MDFFVTYIYKVICGQPEPNTKELQAMTNESKGIFDAGADVEVGYYFECFFGL